MNYKIKIPFLSKLFAFISVLGISFSLFFIYNLNLISNNYSGSEKIRLNLLFIFIFSISLLSLYKLIFSFKSKSFVSNQSIESKILILKKFAENEKLGIITESENQIELIYKSKFLGFYSIIVIVDKESFEYNVFQIGGKPFDWGLRKKLLKRIENYLVENKASL
jgi:hypothetical protein